MRIEVEFRGRAKDLWESDPRVAAVMPEIWRHLEKFVTGDSIPRFRGAIGIEYVLVGESIVVALKCERPRADKLEILDVIVMEY